MTMTDPAQTNEAESEPIVFEDMTASDVREVIGELEVKNLHLAEALGKVEMMQDAQGWKQLYEYGPDGGLSLAQLKQSSRLGRELLAANPIIKRGSQLRNTYVWGGGVRFRIEKADGSAGDLPAAFRSTMKKPRNKRYFFSATAQEELERTAFTDGNIFALVDPATSTAIRIPLGQITGDLRDPSNPEEIWMFRREWSVGTDAEGKPSTSGTRKIWYYTDAYSGVRKTRVEVPGGVEEVDPTQVIVHQGFNQQVGWAYGVPDVLPVMSWARLYREAMVNGFIMSKALAQLAFKMTAPTKESGTKMSAEVGRPGQGGRALTMSSGQDITTLSSAGRGYDFASLRPVAAHIAAGLEVSVVALLSDPSAAGSNNGGSSTTLDAPAKATAIMRRRTWDDFLERLGDRLGSGSTLVPVWRDLPDDTVYRLMQAWALVDASNKFAPEVVQAGIADVMGIDNPGEVPDPPAVPPAITPGGKSTADTDTTGQGQSTGNGDSPNDHSTDQDD